MWWFLQHWALTSNTKNQKLADIILTSTAWTKKLATSVLNGWKDTFWLSRTNAKLHCNNAIWSNLTVIKIQGETVDVIFPFQVLTQFLTQITSSTTCPTQGHTESKEIWRIMSLFLQKLLGQKFLHQMLSFINPSMHLDGHVLWISMVQHKKSLVDCNMQRLDRPPEKCTSFKVQLWLCQVQGWCQIPSTAHVYTNHWLAASFSSLQIGMFLPSHRQSRADPLRP